MLRLGSAIKLTTPYILLIAISFSLLIDGRVIKTEEQEVMPIPEAVIGCRASCLDKFLFEAKNEIMPIENCQEHSYCAMCWDFCELLHQEKPKVFKSMCTDQTCLKGCKHACGYYSFANWINYANRFAQNLLSTDQK